MMPPPPPVKTVPFSKREIAFVRVMCAVLAGFAVNGALEIARTQRALDDCKQRLADPADGE